MQIIERKLPQDHNLFLFGDDHMGIVSRYTKGWEKLCHMMNSTYEGLPENRNFGIDHGDHIEARCVDHPYYNSDMVTQPRPLAQNEDAIKARQPIKHKLLFMLEGNHPFGLAKFGLLTRLACDNLGILYGTYTAKVIIRNSADRIMYKSFHTHGSKNISSIADDPRRRLANMELILKRHLKHKAGDCILMCKGHAHKLLVTNPKAELYLTDFSGKIKQKYTTDINDQHSRYIHPDHRFYVCTGSFLRLYTEGVSGYAERFEYDPIELGFAVALVRGGKLIKVKREVI